LRAAVRFEMLFLSARRAYAPATSAVLRVAPCLV
jgi:hypothetical protein